MDSEVKKEIHIRKTILKDFNKTREDFKTFKEYNDYLEQVEDIIFNLVNGIDVEETKKKIKEYKKENEEQIIINQSKKVFEEQLLLAQLKAEQEMEEKLKMEQQQQQKNISLDNLILSKLNEQNKITEKEKYNYEPKMLSQIQQQYLPQPIQQQKIQNLFDKNLSPKELEDLKMKQLRAGGWKEEYIKKRAIEEAISSLYI
jgi:hypothetical protein